MKLKVLFLCTHNSVRSQMSEGILRHIAGNTIDAYSAGTVVTGVNPFAIKVMAEKGIDITKQYSKHINDLPGIEFDYVVTVCDRAKNTCPVLPGQYKRIHWSIKDPGEVTGTDDEKLLAFRKTRDLLSDLIKKEFNL